MDLVKFIEDNRIDIRFEKADNIWSRNGIRYYSPVTITFGGTCISGCNSLTEALEKAKEIINDNK